MGKTARWFRGLLGGKKASAEAKAAGKEKKKWGFVKSFRDREKEADPVVEEPKVSGRDVESSCSSSFLDGVEQSKHAIAVAAATAAVAEAAVAAAQAAAAVVRLTSSGRCASGAYLAGVDVGIKREELAAVTIQAAFRGYLARRALKALKGLVKLQALVRGHLVRKQAVDMLRYMEAIVRAQARARAERSRQIKEPLPPSKPQHLHAAPATPEKYESGIRPGSVKHERAAALQRNSSKSKKKDSIDTERSYASGNWLDAWMDEQSWDHFGKPAKPVSMDDDKNDKILEVDPGKPRRRNHPNQQSSLSTLNTKSYASLPDSPSKDSTTAQYSVHSPSSVEVQSLSPLRFPVEPPESAFCTADNSPQFYSASSRGGSVKRGPFTPAKSECSRSAFSGFSDYPNYMSNTESSRAKVRSLSAPKQRPEFEKSASTKRFSLHGCGDGRWSLAAGAPQKGSSLHARFASKAYPGSGRLDRLGMPVADAGFLGVTRKKY